MIIQRCASCGLGKELSFEFYYRSKTSKTGFVKICKTCKKEKPSNVDIVRKNASRRIWRKKPEVRLATREKMLRTKYNISIEQYNEKLAQQDGRCAICDKHQNELKQTMRVDHNHQTGKVRGLLCSVCNKAIGSLRENTILLQNATDYLNHYKQESIFFMRRNNGADMESDFEILVKTHLKQYTTMILNKMPLQQVMESAVAKLIKQHT